MGWCHEFGAEIEPRCSHPMAAGASSCSCPECGTVCRGRFGGGCESVWEAGPRPDAPARPATYSPKPALALGLADSRRASFQVERRVNGAQTEAEGIEASAQREQRPDAGVATYLSRRLTLVETALETLSGRVERLSQAKTALASLADQVAGTRSQLVSMATQFATLQLSQASLEHHVTDLGEVLGKLGVEVDDRLTLVETVLDDLRTFGHQEAAEEPSPEASRPKELVQPASSGG